MMNKKFSFSQLDAFVFCPYSFKLKYIDGVKLMPDTDNAANPKVIGSALHTGISCGIEEALAVYDSFFPIATDRTEEEKIKLERMIPKVQAVLPKGELTYEYRLETENFIGFIDLLVKKPDGKYGIFDFKYSNNVDKYKISPQIHIYKYIFERLNPDKVIDELGYIMVPKTQIRQKKDETLEEFRVRLLKRCDDSSVSIIKVDYDEELAKSSLDFLQSIYSQANYPKREEKKLCCFCDYATYCLNGVDYMILPENRRREIQHADRIKIFLYGAPYSGKTRFADTFPNPIFLNTDGNLNSFTAPYVQICDSVTDMKSFPGWEVFKDAVKTLAAGNHPYETVVIDLIEDVYEYCRKCMYVKLGISHESDNSFKAWDEVRTEFLSVMKMVSTLPMHIIFLSHEDISRDIVSKNGSITAIKPFMQDKIANKLAGFVDFTARLVNNGEPMICLKDDNYSFGGSRLPMKDKMIKATFNDLSNAIRFGSAASVQEIPQSHYFKPSAKLS